MATITEFSKDGPTTGCEKPETRDSPKNMRSKKNGTILMQMIPVKRDSSRRIGIPS